MEWIYLSPHFDDVALSCGGLLWEQTQAGEQVRIWTICAGDPPSGPYSSFAESFHIRWGMDAEAVAHRRAEDIASCSRLGADFRHFPVLDCIYRRAPQGDAPLYPSEEALFGELHPVEAGLVETISHLLLRALPERLNLVCPLAIGGHVDHRLTRAAAEALNLPLWYYADYPYIERSGAEDKNLFIGMEKVLFTVSEDGLKAWEAAIAAHASQISTFWPDVRAMREAIRAYSQKVGGVCLWRQPCFGNAKPCCINRQALCQLRASPD